MGIKKRALNRKRLIILGLLALGAALAWAAAELLGTASSLAQDAGSNNSTLEMISVESIKRPVKTKEYPAGPPCDWGLEKNLRRALQSNDLGFNQASAQAKREMSSSGQVSAGTKRQVMDLAREFQNLSNQYAVMWDSCKCYTRAKLAREAGTARMKSAAVIAGGFEKSDLKAMTDAQDQVRLARREYAVKAVQGEEIGSEDKADLRDRLLPMAKQLLATVEAGEQKATEFRWDAKRAISGGGHSGGGSGGGSGSGGNVKLSPEQQLVIAIASVLTTVYGNLRYSVIDLINDLTALIMGQLPPGLSPLGAGACFIGASQLE